MDNIFACRAYLSGYKRAAIEFYAGFHIPFYRKIGLKLADPISAYQQRSKPMARRRII